MAQRRVPLSLSELKRKRDEKDALEAKPIFLSKADRQQLALARLAEKRAKEKSQQNSSSRAAASRDSEERDKKRLRTETSENGDEHQIDHKEREQIHRHYMKIVERKAVKGKKGRQTERNRFRFDWDASEDTMAHEDELRLQLRKQQPVQFGKGIADLDDYIAHTRDGLNGNSKRRALHDNRHWSEKPRNEMTDRDWRIFREDYVISIKESKKQAPLPARNWDETGLSQEMLHLIRVVAKYENPSPIQMASIPIALSRRDCIGLAETGSGKTAAFVLPMLVHISRMPEMTPQVATRGPYALILAPTRELALQIESESRKFATPLGYRVVHVIGGQGLDEQAIALQAGCEIVVCTPGRMMDLLSRQMAALGNCNYLIMDEADRMIDMGFEPQVAEILDSMPEPTDDKNRRQTFMFSATMSPAVERLARSYLCEPVIISVGETGKAADNVDQKVEYFTTENRRRNRFIELLEILEAPILVFVNTKSGCEMVSKYVESNSGIRPVMMHSGKSQEQREKSLDGFRIGRYKVLIATDVVGRGIDIKGVRHVINFELPKTIEAYTHRIGRTGRAGEKGTAWSLATSADSDLFAPLCTMLEQAGAQIPHEIARDVSRNTRGF